MMLAPDGKTEVILNAYVRTIGDPELWVFWDGTSFSYARKMLVTVPEHQMVKWEPCGVPSPSCQQ